MMGSSTDRLGIIWEDLGDKLDEVPILQARLGQQVRARLRGLAVLREGSGEAPSPARVSTGV